MMGTEVTLENGRYAVDLRPASSNWLRYGIPSTWCWSGSEDKKVPMGTVRMIAGRLMYAAFLAPYEKRMHWAPCAVRDNEKEFAAWVDSAIK